MPRTVTEWIMGACALAGLLMIGLELNDGDLPTVFFGLVLCASAVGIGFASYQEVPATPPSVAMPTFLGGRYDVVIPEGMVFVFPGVETLVIENFYPEEVKLTFDQVRCQLKTDNGDRISGGSVTVNVSAVFVPDVADPSRFRKFLNNGGRAKITKILEGMVGEAVRHYAAEKTWEEITFSKADLSAHLIWIVTNLAPEGGSSDAETVKQFLQMALVNGVADVRDLGISIRRMNVVEIEPEGELKKNAERAAIELLQRTAERTDTDTALQLAKQILTVAAERGEAMTLEKALEFVRIERGRAQEIVVRSGGNGMVDAAAVVKTTFPSGKPGGGSESG